MAVQAKTTVIIISQQLSVSNQYMFHHKLIYCYMSNIDQECCYKKRDIYKVEGEGKGKQMFLGFHILTDIVKY